MTIQKITRWPERRSPDVLKLEVLPVVRVLEAHFSEVVIGDIELASRGYFCFDDERQNALCDTVVGASLDERLLNAPVPKLGDCGTATEPRL